MAKTEAAICYLLAKASPNPISKTSLIKLCYFADLESVRRWGVPITGEAYQRDRYGAVAYSIPNSARNVPGVDVMDYPTYTGNHGTDFCAGPGMPDPEYDLRISEKVVLDDVFFQHGKQLAKDLGNATKQTEPWLKAEAEGATDLDLSVVAPRDRGAYVEQVLSRIDRSSRGTPEQIAERNSEVEEFMRPYRVSATCER